ncbi:MAG: SDR family oxidoreductase [Burkholderiaceae bacterium]|nr:SDR family oxidoreductase [Burkholderiaceae bacterium]
MFDSFEGSVAVITGAGSGFGREFARICAERGMKLALADIQADSLAQTADTLRQGGTVAITETLDVSRSDAVEAFADRVYHEFGATHLLFNNAGVAAGGYVWENTIADWEWVLGVNLWGVINGIHAFVPRMIAGGQAGHIVNTASVAGLLSPPTMGVYNVSKHGVVTLTESLYHDLRVSGSRLGASVLCPAFVPTGINRSERNRPQTLQNAGEPTASMQAAQRATDKAVSSGKISAADVATMTFDAIEQDRFYIVTHPRIMDSVRLRCEDVAALRNPTDPYAYKPEVGHGG